ncbi:dynamin family protein [Clostridium folliculivorans]|uniref:Dynamin N-terminal domain-containing protein n=1 Tax=Clostridium folliculivorans TaxID=2886038 RepID=A0A9W5Y226_9CLOT|nr:dynamin family protein [Clostridium folliculivorans]GKU25198.1 hypothetical protein CFOLD11_20240 [Clostridium folliculivorans]GKU31296.1 hypothetical protein CFB3_34030 [Clostridium folliculivorans]
MDIKTITENSKLLSILNKYSGEQQMGDTLENISKNLNLREVIIPVLGMQGMGKSTLINSILAENILPNEADETTCVPVEVKYGKEEKAIVYFKDSSSEVEIYTRDDLNKYVDNEYNPGNEKNVSHIVLYRNVDLLKGGITIVDLPGVGSLTAANQDTTMRYIKNLCTAIFVIPTTPTIRRSEEIFIKGVWRQFASAIFVQNNFGESKREVRESVEFNTKVLREIAKSINAPFNDEIIVVNAYDAISGMVNKDDTLVGNSNIFQLIERLDHTVKNWKENESKNLKSKVALMINSCKRDIDNNLREASFTEEELRNACDKEEEDFKVNTKKLQAQIEEIEDFLDEKEDEVSTFVKKQAKKCVENIRSEVFRVVDSGVVDGQLLTDTFTDYQQQYFSEVLNDYFDFTQNIIYEISELLEEISNIVKLENDMSINALNFNNGQAFKFEKGIKAGFDIAGAIAGGAIFVAIQEGALLGTLGGPLGTAIGALAGAVVGVVFTLVGNKSKKAITAKRASNTKLQLEQVIDEVGKLIKEELINSFENISSQVKESLDNYLTDRKKAFEEIKLKNIEKCKDTFKSNYSIEELSTDKEYIEEMEILLNE